MRFTKRTVAHLAIAAAAVAMPVTAAAPAMAQTPAKAAAADPVFCPYRVGVDAPATALSVYPDAGGQPNTQVGPVGSLPNGSTVTAYRDVTAQSSDGNIWRKLGDNNWAFADHLYINGACFS